MIKLNIKGTIVCNDIENNETDNISDNSDAHEISIVSKRVRELPEVNLRFHQQLTLNQEATVQDHKKKTRKYDMISIFGARPPELVSVFQNPKVYFRLCHINDSVVIEDVMRQGLHRDVLIQLEYLQCVRLHLPWND